MTDDVNSPQRLGQLQNAIEDMSQEQLASINSKIRFWYLSTTAHVFRVEEKETFCGRQIDLSAGRIVTQQSNNGAETISPQIEDICEKCFNRVLQIYEQNGQKLVSTESQSHEENQLQTTSEITKTVTRHLESEDFHATVDITIEGKDELALKKAQEIEESVQEILGYK
ncbi:hypothetical protein [Halocatena marina]|uniref:hypothetical protein n=1 Tax=Halocatena marina TaxID=2934937 RepID=UPI00200D05EA|nr:hypothetical protein [Halocatena marina]